MKNVVKIFVVALLCAISAEAAPVLQPLRLPRFFGRGMVLQRDAKNPVWGWGAPGAIVTVTIGGQKATTTVASNGTWRLYLGKLKAGGPYEMRVMMAPGKKGGGSTSVKAFPDVLVGDIYLCSGQSNMELPIRRCMDVVADEVKDYSNRNIRYLKLPHQFNYVQPNADCQVKAWQDITPENCAEVSAICYFMARELQERTGVPVGIVNSAVGGTRVEAWIPYKRLIDFPGMQEELSKSKYHDPQWPDSVRRAEARAASGWDRQLTQGDRVLSSWREPDYDFAAWDTCDIFADNWSRGARNGSYWFRTTVQLPASAAAKEATLRFGAMKDADSIFVNGQCVGNTTYEYPPRIYKVPEGLLREGENEIVVHLISQSGRPNFTEGKLYQLEVGGDIYPLPRKMQMAVGCTMPARPRSTYFVDTPTGLHNAMIAPFTDIPFRGLVWYQGESNVGNPKGYAGLLEAMVASRRQQFGTPLPTVIVQLPAYMGSHPDRPGFESSWTRIRYEQLLASQLISRSALVSTLDTGEPNDIHPQQKILPGQRVAQQMMRLCGFDKTIPAPPTVPATATWSDGHVTLTFAPDNTLEVHTTPSLGKIKADPATSFAVEVDGKWQWATPALQADGHTVELTPTQGGNGPVTRVRYCWDDVPRPCLFTTTGIPVPQFEVEVK